MGTVKKTAGRHRCDAAKAGAGPARRFPATQLTEWLPQQEQTIPEVVQPPRRVKGTSRAPQGCSCGTANVPQC